MSNFICEKCGAECVDTPLGYITGCKHYPADFQRLPADMEKILYDNLWELYEDGVAPPNAELSRAGSALNETADGKASA